jgi:hypothetical protein
METLQAEDGTEVTRPIAAEYSLKDPLIPKHLDGGISLCLCEMTRNQFQAAMQDMRLVVLDSIHSSRPVHSRVAEHLAPHGVSPEHTVHDVLCALYEKHGDLGFLPDV